MKCSIFTNYAPKTPNTTPQGAFRLVIMLDIFAAARKARPSPLRLLGPSATSRSQSHTLGHHQGPRYLPKAIPKPLPSLLTNARATKIRQAH
jgi:hypothetical protein